MRLERLQDVAEDQAELEQGEPLEKTARKGEQEQKPEVTPEENLKFLAATASRAQHWTAIWSQIEEAMRAALTAEAKERETSHTDQSSSDIDDFFTEWCNMELRGKVEVKTPQTRTRRSSRARQRFRQWERKRERAMMEEEDKKAEEAERRSRLRGETEDDLNKMLEKLGFADWRVVCRHEDEESADSSRHEEPEP